MRVRPVYRRSAALVGLAAVVALLAGRLLPAVAGTPDGRWPNGVVNVYVAGDIPDTVIAAAERWTWLVVLAYTQLRLARPLVTDHRLPWERPRPAGQLTPYRVRRVFSHLRTLFGTPAAAPKPCGHPAGRSTGRRYRPAARTPAVKLTP